MNKYISWERITARINPNDCYQRYQEKINKLFSCLIDSEKQ
ncbi:MAG TPA: hypothetical protein PLM20_10485 [Syntrophomonadaceae bacterium]|nr:hypothetical protein [Syntrophomonadaceae bacterium]